MNKDKPENHYFTKIPDSVIGLRRAGKLSDGEFSVYVMLTQLVKMLNYKNQSISMNTTRLTNQEIADHCGVGVRYVEKTLKKFRELKIIESTTGKEMINGKWRTKSRKITFLVSAYKKR